MSWFSDFAKTALTEAQKRIDKVLDIEDENSTKTDMSYKLTEPKLGNFQTADQRISTPQKSSLVTSPRLSMRNNQAKKRGKPMKLGSSLSRKSFEEKPTKSNDDVSINKSTSDSSVFEEISLEDSNITCNVSNTAPQNSETKEIEVTDSRPSLSEHDAQLSELRHNEKLPFKESFIEKDKSFLNGLPMTSDNEQLINCEKPVASSSSPVHNHFDSHVAVSDSPHSPCGSTTASSEIEILDQESSVSEASAVLRFSEFDIRSPMVTSEACLNLQHRVSPEQVESEASDIVRISGYCSSPLSVGSCDGSSAFILQSKLSNSIEDHTVLPKSDLEEAQSDEEETLSVDAQSTMRGTDVDELQSSSDTQILASDIFHENTENTTLHSDAGNTPLSITNQIHLNNTDVVSSVVFKTQTEDDDFEKQTLGVTAENHYHLPSPLEPAIDCEISQVDDDSTELQFKLDETASSNEKFEVYEQQLLTLSLNNAKLNEENDNLRSELRSLKIQQDEKFDEQEKNLLKTVENLSEKLEALELEKSEICDQFASVQADLSTRLTNAQVQHLLAEKEESIQGLLQEGEVLSKQHLQLNNTIKKLRSKLSDRESATKDLTELIDKLKDENKSLKSRLSEVQGQSSEDRGAAKRLSEAYQGREAEITGMRCRLEEAEEKKRAAQVTLDAAYKDLAEMNKKVAALQCDKEAELKDSESLVTKRMQQEVDKLHQEHEHKMHMRMLQLGELQDALERNEAVCARKEDQLRKEVKDLQQRLQESEMRNHELSETISESTRPILRQMENLQSTYSTRAKTWEALEKSLTARLGEAQVELSAARGKERSVQMSLVDFKSRVSSLEQQLNESRSEKSLLNTELEQLRTNAGLYNEKLDKLRKEYEISEKNSEEIKSKARRDRLTLENQLDMEKVRSEVERKKFVLQLEALQKEKEKLIWMNRSDSVMSSASALNTDVESVGSGDTFNNLDVFERQSSSSGLPAGVYDSVRSSSNNSAFMENLQSQLKMRDGEIAQLQGEINTLERTRSSMAEEIVRLTNENEDLNKITKDVEDLKRQLHDVKARHDAVLTMYGEKAEEAEELRLDLQDVKTMYRHQIDTLLKSQ